MITFGLTGSICCGKSTVTKTLVWYNIPVIDADQVARDVVVPGSKGLDQVISSFGKDFLLSDGTLDRIKLGTLVFSDKKSLDTINHIMLPLIKAEIDRKISLFSRENQQLLAVDGALLIETNWYKEYDKLVVVECSEAAQLERLMRRNALTEEQARARMAAQMPTAEKIKYADFIINTDDTIDYSICQTVIIIQKLRSLGA